MKNIVLRWELSGIVFIFLLGVLLHFVFEWYTAIIGEEILIVDILIFLVAIIVGQLISYRIMTSFKLPKYANIISLIFIILLALILMLFTFYPPHLLIFLDANSGTYGIP